jgi:hypothetical protein
MTSLFIANDNGIGVTLDDLRRDLRRLRRCLSVQSVMLAVILILNLMAPIAVVVSR